MANDEFFFDLGLLIVFVPLALVIGLGVLQYHFISRTDGLLRWIAAAPSLIILAFVVLNVISPSNIWPIALVLWVAIAFVVHVAAWLIVRMLDPSRI